MRRLVPVRAASRATRTRPRSATSCPTGCDGLRRLIGEIRRRRVLQVRGPACASPRRRSRDELEELADGVLDLQT